MENEHSSKENWKSRTGLILAVAGCAIGLGNFLRFPGIAVKNGGGAFMIPYIISFFILGLPVCISEWMMGKMGNRHGHSAPNLYREFLNGVPLRIVGMISLAIPILVYVYYVFIEAWCLTYAFDYLQGSFGNHFHNSNSTSHIIQGFSDYFKNITGSENLGDVFFSKIIFYTGICFLVNFILVYRGISKGIEQLANLAIPVMILCAFVILFKVLTLDNIEFGLGKMWNPDWTALWKVDVWIVAAGQIFFSLSIGFGITMVFASFLKKKDDAVLPGLSAATLNEFMEVIFGGMITIPIAFLFLGAEASQFGTFGTGFIALPSVFHLMDGGQFFGFIWFFVLFIAALTSSVTMLQPGIIFLEEFFLLRRKSSSILLFLFTFIIIIPILYFNKNYLALDSFDFWIGTILIYLLATIQIVIFSWKIGVKKGMELGGEGSVIKIPKIFLFITKFITPTFLILVFCMFSYQSLPAYLSKMKLTSILNEILQKSHSTEEVMISRLIFFFIIGLMAFIYYLVHIGLNRSEQRRNHE